MDLERIEASQEQVLEKIVEFTKENSVDMIIMGSRGLGTQYSVFVFFPAT